MVKKNTDYLYVDGLDGIVIDGSILPLRTGAARRILRGEDKTFLIESLQERSLAATGRMIHVGSGETKYRYSRIEDYFTLGRLADSLASPEIGYANANGVLNASTDINEFTKIVDATGERIGLWPYFKAKTYPDSRIYAIGDRAYHHEALKPVSGFPPIITDGMEADAYENAKRQVVFYRSEEIENVFRLPDREVVLSGHGFDGKPITETIQISNYSDLGSCVLFEYGNGVSILRYGIEHRYVKKELEIYQGSDMQNTALRVLNVPPNATVIPIARVLVDNSYYLGPTDFIPDRPYEHYYPLIPSYHNKYFMLGGYPNWYAISGPRATNTVEFSWETLLNSCLTKGIADIIHKPPFVRYDVTVPASEDEFDPWVGNYFQKFFSISVYIKPVGALIILGDHTKWW